MKYMLLATTLIYALAHSSAEKQLLSASKSITSHCAHFTNYIPHRSLHAIILGYLEDTWLEKDDIRGHYPAEEIIFAPDSDSLSSESSQPEIRFWSIKNNALKSIQVLAAHKRGGVRYSPDGKYLAIKNRNDVFEIWHQNNGVFELLQNNMQLEHNPLAFEFSANNAYFIAEDASIRKIHIGEIANKSYSCFHTQYDYQYPRLAPWGNYFTAFSLDARSLEFWSLSNCQPKCIQNLNVFGVSVFSSLKNTFLTCSYDTIQIWTYDESKSKLSSQTIKEERANNCIPQFSSCGLYFIIPCRSTERINIDQLKIYKKIGEAYHLIQVLETEGRYTSADFCADGKHIKLESRGSAGTKIKLYVLRNNLFEDVSYPWADPNVTITPGDKQSGEQASAIAFSPNGKYLVTGLHNGSLKLWKNQAAELMDESDVPAQK